VNLCSRKSPYSLNCRVGDMLVFRMLCRITQSSDAQRTAESVSVMDQEQTMGVNSRVLDQKQQNIFGRISLFWTVQLQVHYTQLNRGDHDWLIQTPVSTVQRGMLEQTLVRQDRTRNSETSLTILSLSSEARCNEVAVHCWTEMISTDRHRPVCTSGRGSLVLPDVKHL